MIEGNILKLTKVNKWGGFLQIGYSNIPSILVLKENLESFFIEVNILKKKWLLSSSYNSHKRNTCNHLLRLNKGIDVSLKNYDNILVMGDLNSAVNENLMVFGTSTVLTLLLGIRLTSIIIAICLSLICFSQIDHIVFNKHAPLKQVFLKTQPVMACSKLTIKTLEQGVKCVLS